MKKSRIATIMAAVIVATATPATQANAAINWKHITYTDEYVSEEGYKDMIKEMKDPKVKKITYDDGQVIRKTGLKTSVKKQDDKICLTVKNTSGIMLEEAKIFCKEANGTIDVFIVAEDFETDDFATYVTYKKLKIGTKKITNASMKTKADTGNIDMKLTKSEYGARIGTDADGVIKEGEVIKIYFTLV